MAGAALLRRAAAAAGDPVRLVGQAEVFADLVRLRARSGRVFAGARPRSTRRGTILIVSLSDNVFQLKLEGLMAKALELEGYRTVMLTLRNARWAEPYLRVFGVEDFVYSSELIDDGFAAESARFVEQALAGPIDVPSLKRLEYRGALVGQQALSSISRRFEAGRISLDEPQVRAALAEVLAYTVKAVLGAEQLLDRLQPDLVIFNEKGYAGFGSIYDVALGRGLNVVQFVAAGIHWRDALLFKRFTPETRRLHPASLSAASWDEVRRLPWGDREEAALREEFRIRYDEGEKHPDAGLQVGKRVKSPDEVRRQLGLDPGRKLAVLFSHVLWDANMFYGDDLFVDQEAWLVETVRAACANPRLDWLVKLHPANLYKSGGGVSNDEVAIREAVGELPPHVRLMRPDTDVNTFSMFSVADYGITIRGTIGMELPCFGLPVLTAGTGRYSGFGFTDDFETAEDYLAALGRLEQRPPLTEDETLLAKRHAYGLFRLRPLRFTSYRGRFRPDRPGHPLGSNLDVLLRTKEDVEQASDLLAFANWALGDQLDYLEVGEASGAVVDRHSGPPR